MDFWCQKLPNNLRGLSGIKWKLAHIRPLRWSTCPASSRSRRSLLRLRIRLSRANLRRMSRERVAPVPKKLLALLRTCLLFKMTHCIWAHFHLVLPLLMGSNHNRSLSTWRSSGTPFWPVPPNAVILLACLRMRCRASPNPLMPSELRGWLDSIHSFQMHLFRDSQNELRYWFLFLVNMQVIGPVLLPTPFAEHSCPGAFRAWRKPSKLWRINTKTLRHWRLRSPPWKRSKMALRWVRT